MQSTLVSLGVETFKIALYISLPMLLSGLIAGLIISIFQINETTLSFVPKILLVVVVIIFLMPWMISMMVEFTTRMLDFIPEFIQ